VKVGIVGGGVMGEAILGAALDSGVFAAEDVVVADIAEARRAQIAREYRVAVTAESAEAMEGAGLVVLSVKPQDMRSVHGSMAGDALLVSIMAGVPIKSIAADFQHEAVARVMPNLLVAAKAGMSVWTATPKVSEPQRELVRRLLSSMGRELYVDDEKKLDMATAVSGSGPAYVYLFIEAMVEGAVAVGLTRAQAEELVLQTVYGAAVFATESGKQAADLRAMVTSPAGTTAAGLLELERGAVRAAIIECIRAAHRRAQELGGLA
jgi:pyrroline-5-carboxylate reductase